MRHLSRVKKMGGLVEVELLSDTDLHPDIMDVTRIHPPHDSYGKNATRCCPVQD